MLQYFMRYRIGWFILHIVAIGLTIYLGYKVDFTR